MAKSIDFPLTKVYVVEGKATGGKKISFEWFVLFENFIHKTLINEQISFLKILLSKG